MKIVIRGRKVVLAVFLTLSVILVLSLSFVFLFIYSEWYSSRFGKDGVSFGRVVRRENLSSDEVTVKDCYLVVEEATETNETTRVKVSVTPGNELWSMLLEDFERSTPVDVVRNRINYLLQPIDDLLIINQYEIIGLQLVRNETGEELSVKLFESGYIKILNEEYRLGKPYVSKYLQSINKWKKP